jgi:hypothetical protein
MITEQKKENRHPGIRKITTKSGETKYRLIIDMGERPDGNVTNGARHSRG